MFNALKEDHEVFSGREEARMKHPFSFYGTALLERGQF